MSERSIVFIGAVRHPAGDQHWTRRAPERIRRGADSHAAKLSAAQIDHVHTLYNAGYNKTEIARMLGVARITIWRHLRNMR